MRVALADDHPLVLAAVSDLLKKTRQYEVVAAVTTPSALVQQLSDDPRIDVVITDYFMEGDPTFGDGIRLVTYLIRHFPRVQVQREDRQRTEDLGDPQAQPGQRPGPGRLLPGVRRISV